MTLAFLIPVLPLSLLAGWSDLKTMTIPNWISIALIAAFIVLAPFFMPLTDVGLRLCAAAIVLAIGICLNFIGKLGGGDAKYLAGIAPYVSLSTIAEFMFIFSISLIATLIVHRIAMRIKPLRAATPDWASWEAGRNFPMGISIAAAIIVYLLTLSFGA